MWLHFASTEKLADNLVHFARLLRRAGVPIAHGQIEDALCAVQTLGVTRRDDWQAALAATLVKRAEHRDLFDQAFALFWRNPRLAEKMMAAMLPTIYGRTGAQRDERPHRLEQALMQKREAPQVQLKPLDEDVLLDAAMTASASERLAHKDFETMTLDELADVRAMMRTLRLPLPERLSRRNRSTRRGARIDMRRTVRAQLRGDTLRLAYREPRRVRPPLVILADVSGSMERYTRMLIFFAHAVAQCEARVETFAFGTRLTRITPDLAGDPDRALARLAARAGDWGGGTRIAHCLARFNRDWARRVLGQGASVLLITDGLDVAPDDRHAAALTAEAARLKRSARHLLWLNPLLRYAGFEARAHSIRALLPHCSAFLPAHNLESLRQLGAVFSNLSHRSGTAALAMQARARLRASSTPAH